ncbi:hypothetical protein RFI_33669 [Reticulomyxa filosa]|uniref:Uncharacterized protein n=1 Tax=Reticulomyxa filosa TaxID=46433 RepID=X6LP80_RETFI|nr:hypothetical protein RFI_33669 [Reticulomyxa filosa]|eukprot:ETO03733.1 hypothetical protein RFI_33669 [Reticulomyxa filosa]
MCCPFAQKRIVGMSEIMHHVEMVLEKDRYERAISDTFVIVFCLFFFLNGHFNATCGQQTNVTKYKRQIRPDKEVIYNSIWATPKWMQKWLEQNEVLNKVLDRKTTHLELVRRVLPMYKLFHYNGQLTNDQLHLLWSLTTDGTHEVYNDLTTHWTKKKKKKDFFL